MSCNCKMEEYFSSTLAKLQNSNYTLLTIVLGNESCDLDSAISSIVYALFLNWQHIQKKCKADTKDNEMEEVVNKIFVPILNVERDDYALKTEVAYFLKQHGINESQLVFRNDYDLKNLVSKSKTNIVLVDHHNMSVKDKFLAPYVTEIIDHRPIDKTGWNFKDDVISTIEITGSCCTLIAQRIKDLSVLFARDVDFFNAYPACSTMLHSTIIFDTVNFSKEFNNATPRDVEVVLFLESLIKPKDVEGERKSISELLSSAKSNVSSLTAAQLLKKDLKTVGSVLIPSFPILVKDFLLKPDVYQSISSTLTQRQCDIAVLLGLDLTDGIKRDAAVYSEDTAKVARLSEYLQSWLKPQLSLVPTDLPSKEPRCIYLQQNNLSATRKQYVPAINEFLLVKNT